MRAINRHADRSTPGSGIAHILVAQLKRRAIALAKHGSEPASLEKASNDGGRPRIDKSVLAIPEVKRAVEGASPLRGEPALVDLRPEAGPRPSS